MRQFYLEYNQNEKLQTLSREIGWSHNVAIFQKCKDNFEREFYLKSVLKFGWSYRVLDNHIDNKSYEKYLLNQTNFDKTLPNEYKYQAKLAVKDEYNFDFLELSDEHNEYEHSKIGRIIKATILAIWRWKYKFFRFPIEFLLLEKLLLKLRGFV